MDFTQFSWRDGVILIAVGIGVYAAVMLLRLLQVGQGKGDHPNHVSTLFGAADPAAVAANESAAVTSEYGMPYRFPSPQDFAPTDKEQGATVSPASSQGMAPGMTFSETLGASRLEQEVRQLRAEVAALREEMLDLQAAHRVAPQYADAMALARRGFDARGIADHCGIALGEAELVMALARGGDDPDTDGDYDAAGPSQDAMSPLGGSERSERGGVSYGVAGQSQDAMRSLWGRRAT